MSDSFDVVDVQFLTPARVTIEDNGSKQVYDLSIDLANRKVYSDGTFISWGDKIFEFLDAANPLPSDFFSAPDDVYEKAQSAFEEARKTQEEHVGEI